MQTISFTPEEGVKTDSAPSITAEPDDKIKMAPIPNNPHSPSPLTRRLVGTSKQKITTTKEFFFPDTPYTPALKKEPPIRPFTSTMYM